MPRTCKICKTKFEPTYNSVQMCCSWPCALEYAKKEKDKKWKKEKKELKEKLKTKKDYEKELETVFNKFIRLRDKDNGCISCDKKTGTFRLTAGHYFPAGSYKNIRFDEDNVHGQCWFDCNKSKSGNLAEYKIRLVQKIGIKRFEALEQRRQEPRKYTIPELIDLKKHYKKLIKDLETN